MQLLEKNGKLYLMEGHLDVEITSRTVSKGSIAGPVNIPIVSQPCPYIHILIFLYSKLLEYIHTYNDII